MFSMSLDVSFSESLKHMLAYFTKSALFVLELIGRARASNLFETQNLGSMQPFQEILPGKKIELASSEMELASLRWKFSELNNFKAASSSRHITTGYQSRLKTAVSDFTVDQQLSYSKFGNGGASSSKAALEKTAVISHPTSKACSSFRKGNVILQASEAEQLNTRLKILEEENENLKQAFLEIVVDRKKIVYEICQLFQTLRYSLHRKDQEMAFDHQTFYGIPLV